MYLFLCVNINQIYTCTYILWLWETYNLGIYLVNVDTQEQVHLTTSAVYQPIWYYYIPAGTYEVVSIEAQNAKIKVNGFEVEVGDEVVFSSIDGSVIAIPDSE